MAYKEWDSSASGHDEPWIQWFCGLKGHEMFCEVERAYIEDGFNLYGLRACVPNFSDCLDLILDRIGPDDSDDSHLTQSACTLYGLIHQRYILTAHGLDAMYNKYAAKEFGTCPLVQCAGQPVLPVGLTDEVGADTVKVFCPKCQSIYHPPPSRSRGVSGAVDGASFGTTFPHLFLMTFNNLVPDSLSSDSAYVPRVFGFRVHQSARQRNGTASVASFSHVSHSSRGVATKSCTSSQTVGNAASANAGELMPDGSVQTCQQGVSGESLATSEINKGESSQQVENYEGSVEVEKSPLASMPPSVVGEKVDESDLKSPSADGSRMLGSSNLGNGDTSTYERDSLTSAKQTNSCNSKRKSKGSGGSHSSQFSSNGKGSENGESSMKKQKRQKRPDVGVT